jgi:hypothetical protein
MGQKDIISKQIFKRILMDVATYIFKLQLETVELIETEQQRIEDRRADLVARVKDSDGKAFILHIEIQNQNQKDMPDRMLRYLTDIRLNYPGEMVFQYLLYIGKAALAMPDRIQTAQLQYCYMVIDMHDLDYHFFINQNSPDAIVMALLCDIKEMEMKAVIHEVFIKLMATLQNDSKKLREYLSMVEILASNRNINLDIQQEFEMLQIEIEKLPSFMMGQEKGMKKGMAMGARERALMIAKQLIKRNFSLEEIAQVTGIEVTALASLDQE